ncbi:MAG: LysM peptidoglycan-binding domain-containing protein [Clostridia bacterium]|nr:LysM peptidoglycan-binding domain-containing protein [Clostridia bacterium]
MNEKAVLPRIILQMFTLTMQKCGYFRVKEGQTAEEIERVLRVPVSGEVFSGRIIVSEGNFILHVAKAGEGYKSIAARYGVDEEELKRANSFKAIYPTCRVFVPEHQPL